MTFARRHPVAFWAILLLAGQGAMATPARPDASAPSQESFYSPEQVQTLRISVSQRDLDFLHASLPRRVYVAATVNYRGMIFENVGIRYKGNSSSQPGSPFKRSFLLKFDEFEKGQSFLGLKRVALDNGIQFGSLFSEPLITAVLRDLNVTAPRCNYARVFLNDRFHGIYVNIERIDEVFIRSRFDGKPGALYKVDEGGAGSNLAPVPPNTAAKLGFEPKSSSARAGARDVLAWIERLDRVQDNEFEATLRESLEVEAFLKTMAVMLFAGAFDQLTGWNPHNYYLYHDDNTRRWHYLPWDLDVAFADHAFNRIPVIEGWHAAWPIAGGPPRPVLERIIETRSLLNRYRALADQILEQHFHPDVLIPKLENNYALIQQDLERDPFPKRRITNPSDTDYASIVASQKAFIRERYRTARMQLHRPGERPKKQTGQAAERQPHPGTWKQGKPSHLSAVVQGTSSVALEWTDNADGEAGHILQRAEGEQGVFRNHIGQPGSNVEQASDRHVQPGGVYRYRVYSIRPSAQGPDGSPVSNTVTVRIPAK